MAYMAAQLDFRRVPFHLPHWMNMSTNPIRTPNWLNWSGKRLSSSANKHALGRLAITIIRLYRLPLINRSTGLAMYPADLLLTSLLYLNSLTPPWRKHLNSRTILWPWTLASSAAFVRCHLLKPQPISSSRASVLRQLSWPATSMCNIAPHKRSLWNRLIRSICSEAVLYRARRPTVPFWQIRTTRTLKPLRTAAHLGRQRATSLERDVVPLKPDISTMMESGDAPCLPLAMLPDPDISTITRHGDTLFRHWTALIIDRPLANRR